MIAAFIPIWALTALGFVAGRFRLLGPEADRVLGGFVFHLAMPAALFSVLTRTPLRFSGPALGAFAAGTVLTMATGFVLSGRVFGRKPGAATIGAMAAGYVNSSNLGIPVAIQVLGDATFLTGVLLFQVLVVTPLVLILLDRDAGRRLRPARLATLPLRNPVILGLAAGALCSASHWRPPAVVAGPLALLGAAAVPAALVTLGLSLTERRPAVPGERTEVLALSALKLLAQPLLAYLFGVLAQVRPPELLALVVCAALPTAQNVYIFAREYGRADSAARGTVIVSTALSMVTLAAAGWLLG
ncbi:AEC family transporter [Sphaerisporangium fuscum]|uniref:AEC family transporter n=1 Tax=Sphaerisporangium fuscum TaxID=2835868 RepID=UPI001BDC10DC|nr:AEC family transporter [Sphaerisporangium fuscum]